MAISEGGLIGFAVLIGFLLILYSPAILPYLRFRQFSLRTLLALVAIFGVLVALYPRVFPTPLPVFTPEGRAFHRINEMPICSIYWFRDSNGEVVSAFLAFGDKIPQIMISNQHCDICVPSISPTRISIPQDGSLHVLDPMLRLHKTKVLASDVAADLMNVGGWGQTVREEVTECQWQ